MPLSRNLGTLTSWNPLGHSRPVTGLLYLYLLPFFTIKFIDMINPIHPTYSGKKKKSVHLNLQTQFFILLLSPIFIYFNSLQTCFIMLHASFWVISRHLNFICRHFGTLYLLHLHTQVGILHTYLRMETEQTDSVPKRRHIKFRRRGNYPEESAQHSENSESLKSRILHKLFFQKRRVYCTKLQMF